MSIEVPIPRPRRASWSWPSTTLVDDPFGAAVLYLAIAVACFIVALWLSRVPPKHLPTNPVYWYIFILDEGATRGAGRYPLVLLLCLASLCCFAAFALIVLSCVLP